MTVLQGIISHGMEFYKLLEIEILIRFAEVERNFVKVSRK